MNCKDNVGVACDKMYKSLRNALPSFNSTTQLTSVVLQSSKWLFIFNIEYCIREFAHLTYSP